ncbi:pyridoxal phosphate-dependent aminotransferase [Sporosarcina sp. P26b]|uniref:MalY/PatB family protein n=1 Tax=Sporosarcina TaxID=1569 RepID=UPI000A179CD4|nr:MULTISPECIES: MalY/PatB family protein [Sporosarcina]ARK22015.1 aminotransferase [Sporosarcina ureae]PIC73653.1 pyridoxal phosphate-dependent aminotransferase [Sporosarcina sp. P17b]PIC96328.1 pyridoxal phosphate-dependent aminotransferase [Sporosarcina sp. P26b]
MKYDFTTRINRKNAGSLKWNQMYEWNPDVSEEVIPLSVADMELKNPPEVIEGLKEYLDEAVLGYTGPTDGFLNAVVNWQKKRHNWEIKKEWIVNTAGVLPAFYTAIRAYTNVGDGVIIFRPVYYPFGAAIDDNKRTEVNVPLLYQDGEYTIDFEAFEKAAADPKNKILIFCSPHNPVGRVWKRDELEKVAEIAVKHSLYVISDEIWYDFVMPGYTHTVLATVNEKLNDLLITCTAPSKSFNLAGMMNSSTIISNEELREKFRHELGIVRGDLVGILGYKACELAYTKSEAWLDELLKLLDVNQRLVHEYFKENFPQIKAPLVEGTYLQWLDFRELDMTNEELEEFLHMEAEFFTDEGYVFGEEGNGFERINIALPTDALEEALHRLGKALQRKVK